MTHEKIEMLIGASRYDHAETQCHQALAENPNDAYLLCLLGVAVQRQNRLNEAEEVFRQSIEQAPEFDEAYAQLAMVLDDRNQSKAALEAIDQAIRLDPEDACHYGIKSRILLGCDKPQEAAEAARTGLQIDAEQEVCRLFYGIALERLGEADAADEELLSLLDDDPDCAEHHIGRGIVLTKSDPKQAQWHFLEALRIDPSEQSAKVGLTNVMKLQSPLIGWFMRSLIWIDKFPFWAVAVMILVVSRVARFLSATGSPGLSFLGSALYAGVMMFCMIAIIQSPLFDLVLFCSRKGRHALSVSVLTGMKWIVIALLACAGAIAWYLFDTRSTAALHAFAWCGVAALVHETLCCDHAWIRKRLAWITLASVAFGIAFLAYDLGVYRPQCRSIEKQFAFRVLDDAKQLSEEAAEEDSDKVQTEAEAEAEARLDEHFSKMGQFAKETDSALNDLRRSLVFCWAPFVLLIVCLGSWSEEIVEFLHGKAPDPT